MTRIVVDDVTLMAEPWFLAVADEQFKIYTTQEAVARDAKAFGPTLKSHRGIAERPTAWKTRKDSCGEVIIRGDRMSVEQYLREKFAVHECRDEPPAKRPGTLSRNT